MCAHVSTHSGLANRFCEARSHAQWCPLIAHGEHATSMSPIMRRIMFGAPNTHKHTLASASCVCERARVRPQKKNQTHTVRNMRKNYVMQLAQFVGAQTNTRTLSTYYNMYARSARRGGRRRAATAHTATTATTTTIGGSCASAVAVACFRE